MGDASLIGAAPFDLGALLQGGLRAPVPMFDPIEIWHGKLLGEVLGDRPNYGTSFALGNYGTVGTNSGAFVHPFTLMSLPSDVPNMAIALVALYRSDATHHADANLPFGPGFYLSGFDFLKIETFDPITGDPDWVDIYRGDGGYGRYDLVNSVYVSPSGLMDQLTWNGAEFVRHLPDGRSILYQDTGNGLHFFRKEVRAFGDGGPMSVSPKISYEYGAGSPLPELASITDTRGVKVVFSWTDFTPPAGPSVRRLERISVDVLTVDSNHEQNAVVDFTHIGDDGRLETITFFPTDVVHDDNPADGTINLGSELTAGVRPVVRLEYETGKLFKIHDKTFASAEETKLWVTYSGDVVVQQVEGTIPQLDPTHTFTDFGTGPGTVTYVDPRGTTTDLTIEGQGRVSQVKMTASDSGTPSGTPREDEWSGFASYEHDHLTWMISYAGCDCGLPGNITTPEGKTHAFTWDTGRGLLETLTVAEPSPGSSRHHVLGYGPFASFGRQLTTYTDPAGKVWTYSYTRGVENQLQSASLTTPPYDVNGGPQQSATVLVSFGARGEFEQLTDGTR